MVSTRAQVRLCTNSDFPAAVPPIATKNDAKTKRRREEVKNAKAEVPNDDGKKDRKPAAKPSTEEGSTVTRKKSRRVTREPRSFLDPRAEDEKDAAMKVFIISELSSSQTLLLKPTLWKTLSEEWQNDRDVALAALKQNYVRACDLSVELQDDKELLQNAVAHNSNQWFHLPYHFKFDADFPRAITHYSNRHLAKAILEQFESLRKEQAIWDVILDSALDDTNGLIAEYLGGDGAELRKSATSANTQHCQD